MITKLNYRYQLPKGIDWPSVTEVCNCAMKWGLVYFYGKHGTIKARQIAKEAIGIGIGLHEYINACYTNKKGIIVESKSKQLTQTIDNFNIFNQEYKPQPIFVEQVICSSKNEYVGTLDCLSVEDGYLVLNEWKTSKAIYDEYELQVEAYGTALQEMIEAGTIELPDSVKKLPIKYRIIRFAKDKKFNAKKDIREFYSNRTTRDAFLGLLKYYNWNKNKK